MPTYKIVPAASTSLWMVLIDGERAGTYATKQKAEEALVEMKSDALGQYQAVADFVAKNFEKPQWTDIAFEEDSSVRRMLRSTYPLADDMIDEDPEAFVEYVKRIANANAMKRPHLRDPNKRPSGYGLSDDVPYLHRLVQNFAIDNLVESGDTTRESADEARATPELIELVKEYDNEVWKAILEIVSTIPPKEGVTPFELWEVEAPNYIFMTLRGEGVNIWDTMWEDSFEEKDKPAIERFLEMRLGQYADIAGGGLVEGAIMEAAYRTTEGGDPSDEVLPL